MGTGNELTDAPALRAGDRDELLDADEVAAVRVITRRWTIEILMALSEGRIRYSELLHGVAGIRQRLLTQRLRDLEASGLVDRIETRDGSGTSTGPGRVQVSYALTPAGAALQPALVALRRWIRDQADTTAGLSP